ncbi:hypothetical protein NERG_02037 [Nematocida ausubeli]|uniref:Uncharacterized protein n=1 Tax=Nematocida ausubeli (strain ATCC PRA-371 / ERTm2) TaxID=1913371 RepID=H8ZEL6_NEMA1|nr:hypothetical protein NERG_02037 [Nematocida ausubeli]
MTGCREIDLAIYFIGKSMNISRRIIKVLLKMHNKKILRVSYEIKRVICKCYEIMVPSINCRSRIVKETDGIYMWRECFSCGAKDKMRVSAKKRFSNGRKRREKKTLKEGEERAEVPETEGKI